MPLGLRYKYLSYDLEEDIVKLIFLKMIFLLCLIVLDEFLTILVENSQPISIEDDTGTLFLGGELIPLF